MATEPAPGQLLPAQLCVITIVVGPTDARSFHPGLSAELAAKIIAGVARDLAAEVNREMGVEHITEPHVH